MNVFRPPGSSTLPRFRPVNTRKRVQVVAIVLAACIGIGIVAWTLGVNSQNDFSTECERDQYVPPVPDATLVNVYNGTQIIGLGATVADELRAHGFTIGKIENDPLRRKIRGTGELRGGTSGAHNIEALRSWQPGLAVVDDGRKGPEVDFVLGAKFTKLNDTAEPPPGTPQTACKPGTGNG
ncbi:MAG TPA: LytR C-terminal domain-containing protein [Sporichthya sp.]|nr:LytR C-terminal domain-containing protein [Sporichthya sp.]